MKLYIYKTENEVAVGLSKYIKDNFLKNEVVNIALSGGNTPKLLYQVISNSYKDENWNKVHFFWVDERCVPKTDDDSNYKLAKNYLFDSIKINKNNINEIDGTNNPKKEALSYSNQLMNKINMNNNFPSFDLIILGLGDDGHTASIFPNQMKTLDTNNCCEVALHPISNQKRITLTKNTINNAKNIVFHVTGKNKSSVVDKLINKLGKYKNYPAHYIKPNNGNLSWFLDFSAASKINKI